jgi:glutamine amidotransferase
MKLVIVDYGMGNIQSISSSLKYLGVENVEVSSDYHVFKAADKLILPGVGSFGKAMQRIKQQEIDKYLSELVVADKKPLLGICLGMQLLGKSSTEDGENEGLGFVDGVVQKFEIGTLKVPHVGFNQVDIAKGTRLYQDLNPNPDFYFTHSYRMMSDAAINQSTCNYGENFVASFEIDNIAGVQFHPELSQHNGLNLLRNFISTF